MSWQALFTAAALLISVSLIASGRFPMDWVALGTLAALYLAGIITPDQALAGFSAPATITLAGIYVVSGGLRRSGAIALIGQWMLDAGGRSPGRLSGLLYGVAGLFSAFMANLAALVILLPLGYRLSRAAKIPVGKLLLPVALFTSLGGYLTLLGTPPNLIAADLLQQRAGVSLGLFSIAVVGMPTFLFALAWVAGFGHRLLPSTGERPMQVGPNLQELSKTYKVDDLFYRLRVRAGSDLAGKRLRDLDLRTRWEVNVVGVARPGGAPFRPWPDLQLEENDEIIVQGQRANILQLASIHHLEPKGSVTLVDLARLTPAQLELAEILIPPYASLVGRTLQEIQFAKTYGLNVLAILREGVASAKRLANTPLQPGDRLLVEGAPRQIQALRKDADIIVLSQLGPKLEDIVERRSYLMLGILGGVMLFSLLPWGSLPMAALLGALLTVIVGASDSREAYEDVDWGIVIFIAALLPLATAMENSGLAAGLGDFLLRFLAPLSPYALLAALFAISVLLTQALPNSLLALILTPIAIYIAQSAGLRPEPLVIAVMAGVSASFLTPITDVIAILVRAPGRYAFKHYVLLNLPIVVVMGLSVIFLAPLAWPW
ncbi:MAG TPA: SLC13 family permease [Caldilineae bacterium]|nr:SLC13 family permease [Caldilineae bacterium]